MYREKEGTKKYFMQAMSQADMKGWLEVMEHRKPVSSGLILHMSVTVCILYVKMHATMPPARITEG